MSDARAGQRGYILALLLGMATVMGILLLKAIPTVRSEVQRDAEEELIFRGESLAKGIRLYRARTGAYPMELEDLLKQRPAVVRRLYRDPLNPTGEWDLVTAVQPGPGGDTRGLPIVGVRFAWYGIHWVAGLILTVLIVLHVVRAVFWQKPRSMLLGITARYWRGAWCWPS